MNGTLIKCGVEDGWATVSTPCLNLMLAITGVEGSNKENSAEGVWLKLETLYMDKGLIDDLANIDVDIDDEDQALMLLTSLPSSYDNFVEMLLYGRDSLTLEDILSSLNLRELKKKGYTVKLQNGKVKVIKGSLMVLSGTMKGNCVYSLDGWAESGEASVGIQEKESLAQGEFWSRSTHNRGSYRLCPCGSLGSFSGGIDECCQQVQGVEAVGGKPDRFASFVLGRSNDDGSILITNRDVVFNESLMYKDTLKGAGACRFDEDVEFEVELQGRTKRTTTIPARYRDKGNVSLSRPSGSKVDGMAAYAFAIAEEKDTHEPITFQEVINSSEKDEWVRAMKEEMSSLKKNHTWELVDQPPAATAMIAVFTSRSLHQETADVKSWIGRKHPWGSIRKILGMKIVFWLSQGKKPLRGSDEDSEVLWACDVGYCMVESQGKPRGCCRFSWMQRNYAQRPDTVKRQAVYGALEAVKERIWLKGLLIKLE
ncbi:hypothetical protein Tco_1030110 [Tanacetum coccineum]|uniref:Retrovirus-related Pol polyprotein from transposon TNT 1-94 n=1 Tax=Tanacetum coccineum TaxID=301880 RepID=A0ABQ5G5G3_9ASTR